MPQTLTTTQTAMVASFIAASSYLVGGIPFALLIGKWVKGIDLRTVGSGNLGATNVARSLGGKWAVLVFFLDFAKGLAAVGLAVWLTPPAYHDVMGMAAALGAILGHVYSPYIKFKGGKGIAVSAGVGAMLTPWSFLWGGIAFFAFALSTRRVSVGSLVIGVSYPITVLIYYPGRPLNLLFAFAVWGFLWWNHRSNIVRLLKGTEPTVTWGIFKDQS